MIHFRLQKMFICNVYVISNHFSSFWQVFVLSISVTVNKKLHGNASYFVRVEFFWCGFVVVVRFYELLLSLFIDNQNVLRIQTQTDKHSYNW